MKRFLLIVAAVAVVVALASPAALAAGGGKVIYDSTVKPLPGNLPSVGAEAYSFTELGDEVTFAAGSRELLRVTVTLSSWGCQVGHWFSADCVTSPGAEFAVAITFNVYSPGPSNTAGALLGSRTQTFLVPYRPSSDNVRCTGGRWFDGPQGCFNGLAHTITFTLSGLHAKLPKDVVWGVTYNSDTSGPNPIGLTNSPEDSLNVGLAPKVRAGHQRFPGGLFWDTRYPGNSCGTPFVPGDFNLDRADATCWAGYVPAAQFNAG